jgi:hypothetical protein
VLETAMVMPLIVLMTLAILQVAMIGRDQLALWHAVRVAVRAGAVSSDPVDDASIAARTATRLTPLDIVTDHDDEWIHVSLRHLSRTSIAMIGPLLPDVTLHASATMRREPP